MRIAYVATGEFGADELAAIGAFRFHEHARKLGLLPGRTGSEVKRTTSHPGHPRVTPAGDVQHCGSVCRGTQNAADLRAICGPLLDDERELDPEVRDELFQSRGWHPKKRLPHTECPINPSPSKSDAVESGQSVVVLDGGVWCHKCGFTPFARLVDPERCRVAKVSPLRQCVRKMAHWAHARHVLRHEAGITDERFGKALYRALLKLWHLYGPRELTDERAEAVRGLIDTAADADIPIQRDENGWCSTNTGRPIPVESLTKYLSVLPAGRCADDEGVTRASALAVAALMGDDAVAAAAAGYPPLRLLPHVDAFEQVGNPDAPGIPFVLPCPGGPPFVYRPPDKRSPLGEHAWEWLDRQFPGNHRGYLKLCIAGVMYAQKPGQTEPNRVMVAGQSGSGKTTTAELAAELCGTDATCVKLKEDGDKFTRAAARAAGGIMILDEIAKAKQTSDALLSLFQSIKVGAEYHELYRGTARLTRAPFMVCCDTTVPRAIVEEVQLKRRFRYVDLGAGQLVTLGRDWKDTSGGVLGWRARGPAGYSLPGLGAAVADAVVSEVLDEVRALGPYGTFDDYAAGLGFPLLSEAAADGVDHEAAFRELFQAVLAAEPRQDTKFKGRGWVVFTPGDGSEVAAAWKACASSELFDGPKEQAITGRQWGATTGVPGLICRYARHGAKVGLQFRVGADRSPIAKYHREVLG